MPNDPSPLVGRASVVSDTARRARAGQGTAFTGPPGSGERGCWTRCSTRPAASAPAPRFGRSRSPRRGRCRRRTAGPGRGVRAGGRASATATVLRPHDWSPSSRGSPTGLRIREREVALLAARGESDQTVATALGITLRTVQTHLSRALAKLGIRRRTDLPSLIGEP